MEALESQTDEKHIATPHSATKVSLMKTELVPTLKRQATRILGDLRESRSPVMITEHGKPAAYLIDIDTFEEKERRMELLEGLASGEKMKRWLK